MIIPNLSVSISELSVCPWKPNDWLPGLWIVVGAGKGKLCKLIELRESLVVRVS
jgi:hypothetical protein